MHGGKKGQISRSVLRSHFLHMSAIGKRFPPFGEDDNSVWCIADNIIP